MGVQLPPPAPVLGLVGLRTEAGFVWGCGLVSFRIWPIAEWQISSVRGREAAVRTTAAFDRSRPYSTVTRPRGRSSKQPYATLTPRQNCSHRRYSPAPPTNPKAVGPPRVTSIGGSQRGRTVLAKLGGQLLSLPLCIGLREPTTAHVYYGIAAASPTTACCERYQTSPPRPSRSAPSVPLLARYGQHQRDHIPKP